MPLLYWSQSQNLKKRDKYLSKNDADDILEKAEKLFEVGKFEESIQLLRPHYDKKHNVKALGIKLFKDKDKATACQILAMNYLALDNEVMCRKRIEDLLLLAPDYDPNLAGAPPLFAQEVELVREELSRTKISSVSKTAEKIELVPAYQLSV